MPKPVDNPRHRWHRQYIEWVGDAPLADLEVIETRARTILSENTSPDLGFRWSLNPYQGCYHGCAYCYARPTHQYLEFGAGTDFDRKIVVKTNAAELLRKALRRPSWSGHTIVLSGNTDCYQPLEAAFRITRQCLEVCVDFDNPAAIITKSHLVCRDIDLLATLNQRADVSVVLSIPCLDVDMARKIEPWAPSPKKRLQALQEVSAAGIKTGISLAPLIPGLNDHLIATALEEACKAGAQFAFMTLIRLPHEVAPVFEGRLREHFPARANKVLNAIQEMREGGLTDARFGRRMVGAGPRWTAIESSFRLHARRLGLDCSEAVPTPPNNPKGQLSLPTLPASTCIPQHSGG